MAKVTRYGQIVPIPVDEILVGDIVHLEPGDIPPVDGILIWTQNLRCDESSSTGESHPIAKPSADEALQNSDCADPFIRSLSQILEGRGAYLVTSVGACSIYGKLRQGLEQHRAETPLQKRLGSLSVIFLWLGFACGLLVFLFRLFRIWCPAETLPEMACATLKAFLRSSVVFAVVVPEGLPLAVELTYIAAGNRMARDGIQVRDPAACEIMGNVTVICSDKTGTLTMNQMRVVADQIGLTPQPMGPVSSRGDAPQPASPEMMPQVELACGLRVVKPKLGLSALFSSEVRQLLVDSMVLNSTIDVGEDGKPAPIGPRTEVALVTYGMEQLGLVSVQSSRGNAIIEEQFPFDSSKKYMATAVRVAENRVRLFVKGAPELLLKTSSAVVRDSSEPLQPTLMTEADRDALMTVISAYGETSLRTIGLAFRDFPCWPPLSSQPSDSADERRVFSSSSDLAFIGILGIQDPLRDGVMDAVAQCHRAGVNVKIVTGDYVKTATAIAKACGILTEGGMVMDGSKFRTLTPDQRKWVLPRLQVLARSSPEDKKLLVQAYREMGEIVAVTGDGINDGPALREADVGVSMGKTGTEIAKEASSIVLDNDDFSSLVKAVIWGRTVDDGIKKFLQVGLPSLRSTGVSHLSSVPVYRQCNGCIPCPGHGVGL